MRFIKRIWLICRIVLLFLIVGVFNSCFLGDSETYSNTPGIVLGFDDYSPDTWEQHFDLFDKYGIKVTFFVLSGSVSDFMLKAQSRGHEIGYHTINHLQLAKLSREQFFAETISPIKIFRDSGIELTSFAYPYGRYKSWMHEELLNYYKVVRGFGGLQRYTFDEMKLGFVDSASIDNTRYRFEICFKYFINKALGSAKKYGKIIVLTSHSISDDDWGITPERLEYVLQKSQEYGLTFYRFKDFQ